MTDASTTRVTVLPSGLTVATDHMASVETVSLGTWIGVGTRHEQRAENGIAHLFEHMVFKGTERRDAVSIATEIEDVGGHMNAYTSREQTAYFAKVLADDVIVPLDLIADILQNSVFDENELERERAVIIQEIGQVADTPDDIVFDNFQEAAFPDQPVGWPVLGRAEVVNALGRDALRSYADTNYAPGRAVISAAGKIDHDWLVEKVSDLYGAFERADASSTEPAAYNGEEVRLNKDLEQLHVILGFQGVSFYDPDFYAMQVLSTVFGGGMSSRLFQEVREKRGLAYSVYSFTASYQDDGLLGVYVGTGESEIAEAIPVIADQLQDLAHNLSDEELARARVQLKSSLLMSRESTSSRCEQLANYMLIHGHPPDPAKTIERIDAIDTAAIQKLVRRLVASAPSLSAIGPSGALEPLDKIAARFG